MLMFNQRLFATSFLTPFKALVPDPALASSALALLLAAGFCYLWRHRWRRGGGHGGGQGRGCTADFDLATPPLRSWGAARVVAFLSARPDLALLRAGSHRRFLWRHFLDVDGEMLLDMTDADFARKGIKPYHLPKIKRVLAEVVARENAGDGDAVVLRPIDPLRPCHDQVNRRASSNETARSNEGTRFTATSGRGHVGAVDRRRTSSANGLSASVEDELRAYLSQRARKEERRVSKFKAAVDRVRAKLNHTKYSAAKGKGKGHAGTSTSTTATAILKTFHRPRSASIHKTPKSAFRVDDKTRWLRGEVIGVGAFGRVYFGLSEKTGMMMAVKEIRCPDDAPAEELEGLVKEISMLKKLVHKNIVGYLGARIERSHFLYIFTQWVPGGSIESLLERFGALTQSMVMNYTVQILRGLEYLHDENVVHRDIKSANILVDENGVIKLSDFGTCKRLQEIDRSRDRGYNPYNLMEQHEREQVQAQLELEQGRQRPRPERQLRKKHSFAGTPFYMAPEVMLQEAYDQSADIWSVGCTVLHMSTNKRPWAEKNFKTIPQLMLHLKKTHQAPAIPLQLGDALRKFTLRCFIRNQEDRPTASRLLEDPFLADSYLIKGTNGRGGHGNGNIGSSGSSSSRSNTSSSSDEDNGTMRQMRRKIDTQRHGGDSAATLEQKQGNVAAHRGDGGFPGTPRRASRVGPGDASSSADVGGPDSLLGGGLSDQELDNGGDEKERIDFMDREHQLKTEALELDSPFSGDAYFNRHGSDLARKAEASYCQKTQNVNPFGRRRNLTRHGSSLARETNGDGDDGHDGVSCASPAIFDGSQKNANPFGGSGNLTRHGSSLARETNGDKGVSRSHVLCDDQSNANNPFAGSKNLTRHGSSLGRSCYPNADSSIYKFEEEKDDDVYI